MIKYISSFIILLCFPGLQHNAINHHLNIRKEEGRYFLPIEWKWINNKLTITKVFSDTVPVQAGNIVMQIDGTPSAEYFNTLAKKSSAVTKPWRAYEQRVEALTGVKNSLAELTIQNKNGDLHKVLLKRNLNEVEYFSRFRGGEIFWDIFLE